MRKAYVNTSIVSFMLDETSTQNITKELSPSDIAASGAEVDGAGSNINVVSASFGTSSSRTYMLFEVSQNSQVQTFKILKNKHVKMLMHN